MENSNISNVAPKLAPVQICGIAGLIYIRYDASIVTKPNGQKKIGGSRPAFSSIDSQPDYTKSTGNAYSLLMGRVQAGSLVDPVGLRQQGGRGIP